MMQKHRHSSNDHIDIETLKVAGEDTISKTLAKLDSEADRPHLHCKPTEAEVQRNLRLSANSSNNDLASRTGDRICVYRTPDGYLHQQLDDSPPTQRK